MSIVKTQIYDGYATIRSRGLTRSKSSLASDTKSSTDSEPMQNFGTDSGDSEPLYENNNEIFYKTTSFSSGGSTKSQASSHGSTGFNDSRNVYSSNKVTTSSPLHCQTFKPLDFLKGEQDYKSIVKTTHDLLEQYDVGYSMPSPPISPGFIGYNSGYKSLESTQVSFYSRPESPRYGKIGYSRLNIRDSTTSPVLTKPNFFEFPDCVVPSDTIASKPPIKNSLSKSVQYRKSFSTPNHGRINSLHSSSNGSLNSCTTIDEIPDFIEHSSTMRSTSQIAKYKDYERRYATLGHPRENIRLQTNKISTTHNHSTGNVNSEKQNGDANGGGSFSLEDLLDCKIGCQTTLRSKPRIPWYELAIKKDVRRQSCPPFEEVCIFYIYNFVNNFNSPIYF